MAITINQSPTTPNATYTNLLYAVSSDQTANAQYQYVMDVVSGSTVLTRIKQYPNPAGAGIFDVGRILNDYLEYETNWDLSTSTTDHTQVQDFTINFGEEYAASLSGSVVLYNGNDVTGSPAVNDGPIQVLPAVVDPNNGIGYDWPYATSALQLTDRPSGVPIVGTFDIMYQSFYNGTGGSLNASIQAINENGTVTDTATVPIGAGEFVTVNVGVDNGLGLTPNAGLKITFNSKTITYPGSSNCNWERVNFAFINNYGFWDTYGVNLPQAKRTSVKREEITTPFVNYSSATSPYSLSSRGKGYYNTTYTDNYSVYTDWIDQTEANWLTQMLESPEVYVQTDAGMVPIIITNTSYEHNTNKASQKTFQYQIQYQFSNQRPSRG